MKVKLGDVCIKITDGSHNPPKGIANSEYLMLSSKNISDDCINLDNPRYLSEEDFIKENKRTNISANDLLMTIVGTIGRVAIVPDNLTGICVQRSVAVLKTKQGIIVSRFLMYKLQNMCPYLEQESIGVAQKGIYLKKIANLLIDVPPLDEQRHIAAVLDKVSDLIALRKKQLAKLDELVKARFVEMFGDPVLNPNKLPKKRIKDVAFGKLTYGSGASAIEFDGQYRYVRITDIMECGELNNDKKSPNYFEEKYILNDGDILFARSGATVGKTFLYKRYKYGKCIFAGYLIRLIPNQKIILPEYLFYFTKTEYYNSFITRKQKTVAQPNINAQEYGDLVITVPSLNLQQQFVDFVRQVDKQRHIIQQSFEKLEILKKSLMQEYFG